MKEGIGIMHCKKERNRYNIGMNTQVKKSHISRSLKKTISHYKLI